MNDDHLLDVFAAVQDRDNMLAGHELRNLRKAWDAVAVKPPASPQPRTVLVMPAYKVPNKVTKHLRSALSDGGHNVYDTGLESGAIIFAPGEYEALERRLEDLATTHGRKVDIAGWSAGGMYGQRLGIDHPNLVRQVISYGSVHAPMRGDETKLIAALKESFERAVGAERVADYMAGAHVTPRVPSTSIYTKDDQFAPFYASLLEESDDVHNVEVMLNNCVFAGTVNGDGGVIAHMGMANNIQVIYAICALVARNDLTQRFDPAQHPALQYPPFNAST